MVLLGIERSKVERDLIFRSHLLGSLCTYLCDKYASILSAYPGAPPINVIEYLREDSSLLEVFLLVLNRRLTAIDDLEFKGERNNNTVSPFLTL